MSKQEHALYQLATKALIFDGSKVLVLINPRGEIDFPGGRVDESERHLPWEDALKRELDEEIGSNIALNIGETLFVSKRSYEHGGTTHHIAAIFFKCRFVSGEVTLLDEHTEFKWLTLQELADTTSKFVSEDEKQHIKNLLNKSS